MKCPFSDCIHPSWLTRRTCTCRRGLSGAWLLVAAGVVLLSGCVGVVPIPPSSSKPIAGHALRQREAGFIKPGVTTRREVEQRLGPCTREIPRARAVAYTWEKESWEWVFFAAGPYSGTSGAVPAGGWHALLIAYDEKGRVRKKEITGLSHRRPLDDQVVRWAGR